MAATTVTIFHNISEDAFSGYQDGHELVPVFLYSTAGPGAWVCADAFEMFNVGTGPVSQDYRARRLRSLSVGDVVMTAGGEPGCYAVGKTGWEQVLLSKMRVLTGQAAEDAVRARYQIPEREDLATTVPMPL